MRNYQLLVALFFMLVAAEVHGQGEFIAGYGLYSSQEISNTFYKEDARHFVSFNDKFNAYTDGVGPLVVGYNYTVSSRVSIGLTSAVSFIKTNYFGVSDNASGVASTKQRVYSDHYTSLARVYYSWVRFQDFTIYSSIAGGLCYQRYRNQTEDTRVNRFKPAYQANLLGFRAGRRLGAFLELGYGFAGVANVGLSLYLD